MAGRAYERSVEYQPGARVNTGASGVYSSLGEKLAEFKSFAQGVYEDEAIPAAQLQAADDAAAGKTKERLPLNAINRAYNEALVRAYALDAYADVHEKLSQFEVEAGTDVRKFKSQVAGYRSGMLPQLLPSVQPIVSAAMQQRELEGVTRIGTLKAAEGKAEAIAASERGLDAIESEISRLYTAGDPVSIARADALTKTYLDGVKGNVMGGLYTLREGEAKSDQMLKNVTRNVAIGKLERAIEIGGDPVKVIEDTMAHASPILSDEEKMQLVGDLLTRLNVHQAFATERERQAELDMKAEWAAGEKLATQLLLRGQLTLRTLDKMVTADQLDPAIARSLRTALKEGATSMQSDERTLFIYETQVLSFTEQQIRDEPLLSWKDKIDLIDKRRQQEGGWPDSNPAQEAKARIDRALGLVPGVLVASLPDDVKRARGRAQGMWYDEMAQLPDDRRLEQAIPIAEKVIKQVVVTNNAREVDRLKQLRESFTRGKDPASMGKAERKRYQDELDRIDRQIERLEPK